MLNKNAKKWVKALRSGKFKQTKRTLGIPDGKFCCLGVACELAIKDGVRLKKVKKPLFFTYDSRDDYLPARVKNWLGLNGEEGQYYSKNGRYTSLVERNDSGKSFKWIANFIESEPKGLFKV